MRLSNRGLGRMGSLQASLCQRGSTGAADGPHPRCFRHAFGRTALVLSGGGALGAFHLGMVRTLLMDGLLPRVLAGSSVGSIICSLVATRTDADLSALFSVLETLDLSFFNNNSPGQLLAHLVTKGTLQDVSVLQHRLKCLIGDHTFQVG